jgi:hypothetical protein
MTNANVEQVVTAVDGQTLSLKYKDGEKKIYVSANAPIVAYVQGDKSDSSAWWRYAWPQGSGEYTAGLVNGEV